MDRVEALVDEVFPGAAGFAWRITYGNDSFVGDVRVPRESALALLAGSVVGYGALLGLTYVLAGPLKPLLALRSAHNLALAVFSAATCVYTMWMMVSEQHFESLFAASCRPVQHRHFQAVSFVFLLSKVWEWFDTVLLIVNGSKVRFLHALHHMTTFWLYAVDNLFPSSIKYGVAVNAFIHAVMYSHYFRPFPRPLRRVITQLQIVQFFLSIWLHSMIWYYDCDTRVHSHFVEYVTPYLFVTAYLVLFINFYVTQYLFSRASGKLKST